MADGRRREAWNHTAQLLAKLHNVNRGRNARVAKPEDFHPMGKDPNVKPPKVPLKMLKTVFVDRKSTNP